MGYSVILNIRVDLGCAKVHAEDNSRLNESSTVMAEAYKKNQQSRKCTRSTRNIHIDNMQEFEPIYYFCSMKDGGIIFLLIRKMYITVMYILI